MFSIMDDVNENPQLLLNEFFNTSLERKKCAIKRRLGRDV